MFIKRWWEASWFLLYFFFLLQRRWGFQFHPNLCTSIGVLWWSQAEVLRNATLFFKGQAEKWDTHTKKKRKRWWNGEKNWNTRKGKPQRNWMRATLWRARLHFSTAKNALSDSGSVALTPISAYTSTLRCSYEGIGQSVCERTRQSPRKKACGCEKV